MAETQITRQEFETLVVQRAWKDDAFRSEFLGNPKETIEKYAEQKLPADLKVNAHAEDDKTIHFVIPAKPADTDQLSDEDLEKVAGGIDLITAALGFFLGATVVGGAALGAAQGTQRNHGW